MAEITMDEIKYLGTEGVQQLITNIRSEIDFDPTPYDIPVLALTGDTSAMTKDNEVSLSYTYGDRSGTAKMKWQGNSSLSYPKKNYTIKFDNEFEASDGWGAQKKYCLKANYIDHSHTRNLVSAKLWGDIVRTREPENTNLFDMSKCTGLVTGSGTSISGTAPSNGILSNNASVYGRGNCYLAGQTYSAGVYRISADVYVTSTKDKETVYIGMYDSNNKKFINSAIPSVASGSWQRIETVTSGNVDNMYIQVQIGGQSHMPSIQIKNIFVTRFDSVVNLFDASKITGFVSHDGLDRASYCTVNTGNGEIKVNISVYQGGHTCFTGIPFSKGHYKISFWAFNNHTASVQPYNVFRAGFDTINAVDNSAGIKSCTLSENQKWELFEIDVYNPRDGSYLTLCPSGDPSLDTNRHLNMNFLFRDITVIRADISALPNGGAVDGFPVALTLNDEFHGLYTFNIPKDDWMMNMGTGDKEAIVCAESWTSITMFGAEAVFNGTDFEIEYVSDEDNSDWVKTSLNTLINAVRNSDGTDLDTTIAQYIDWKSAIDYYIFVVLIKGFDNIGKNYLLVTYDGTKWFFSAYDMDSTYGLYWKGNEFLPADSETTFEYIADHHNLFRLIEAHKMDEVRARYAELRETVMSEDNVAMAFENFSSAIPKTILDEDVKKWSTIPSSAVSDISQIRDWYSRRVKAIDAEIGYTPASGSSDIILTDGTLKLTNEDGTSYTSANEMGLVVLDGSKVMSVTSDTIQFAGSTTGRITGLSTPTADSHAANKAYVDDAITDHTHETINNNLDVKGVFRVQGQQTFYYDTANASQTIGTNNATGGTTICAGSSANVGINGANLTTPNVIPRSNNAFNVGSTDVRYKTIYLTSAANVSSDERLKKDIKPLSSEPLYDFINNLNVVSYNYLDDSDDTNARIGLIAQDVLMADSTIGKFFVEEGSDGYYGLRSSDLVFPLIAAVKSLSAEVAELKAKLDSK